MKPKYHLFLSLSLLLFWGEFVDGQTTASPNNTLRRVVVFYGDVYTQKLIEISRQLDREFGGEDATLENNRERIVERLHQRRISEKQFHDEYDKYARGKADLKRKRDLREAELKRTLERNFKLFKERFAEANSIVLVDAWELGIKNVWAEDRLVVDYVSIFNAFDTYSATNRVPVWGNSVNIVPSRIAYISVSRLPKGLQRDGDDGSLSDQGLYALRSFAKKKGYNAAVALNSLMEQNWKSLGVDDLTVTFQADYSSGDLAHMRKMDGFLGIRFGASKSEVQKYLTTNKVGKIVEAESRSKSYLVVEELELDYQMLEGRKVRGELSFFNDKFFRLTFLIPEVVSFGDVVSGLNSRYYEIDLDDFDFGVYSWFFRQDGHSNTVKLSRGSRGLILDSYNETLFKQAGEANRKGLWP
ncbi:MAG: hypothetical protein KF881_10750 [Acidobacteria bacterium]|nr:hypothetical protein [Acidobacteriota bacterium]